MISTLVRTGKLKISLLAGALVLFCLFLISFRIYYTGNITYIFLIWNLFLACIPYWISTYAYSFNKPGSKKWLLYIPVWLLFLPNAPYIITDLLHLRQLNDIALWFDVILLFSCAWTSLLLFFLSLNDFQTLIERSYNRIISLTFITLTIFLSGFGIYIGRFLRWNSWDIITNPIPLLYDIMSRFIDPLAHPRTWSMTIFMGVFLFLGYWIFNLIREKKDVPVN